MKTVHMIGNAHLDPVWLWGRPAGVDAALATVRSACDRLDEFPEFVFTCSSSWLHEQVERIDRELFRRVRKHAAEGRWQPVGGMVIEPDCNLPSAESFRRQLEHGQRSFQERFGRPARVGYNIDSFGHNAYLPRFLREAGINTYVFMRPGPHEKRLPANLFRWRSPDGAEVTAFRIAGSYTTRTADIRDPILRALADLPAGIEHTMCFFGVGDHGGGPTREQIAWILENRESLPGVRLVLSHPQAFFDAVADRVEQLPRVEGELQHHAIGCYSVERRIKTALRLAEARLTRAEQVASLLDPEGFSRAPLADAWGDVLFNQFHDILGGTSLYAAGSRAAAELAEAAARAEGVSTALTRRAVRKHARPGVHKIIALNPSAEVFSGLVAHEPWLDFGGENTPFVLREPDGTPVLFQRTRGEALAPGAAGLLMSLSLPPGEFRTILLEKTEAAPPAASTPLRVDRKNLTNGLLTVRFDRAVLSVGEWEIRMELWEDPTDTWSHSAGNRFPPGKLREVEFLQAPRVLEEGPLRAAVLTCGTFGSSRVWCRVMMPADEPVVQLRFSVLWGEVRKLLRLRLTPPGGIADRTDLVPGGPLVRPVDGSEYPLAGGLVVAAGDSRLGICAPTVFSGSVETDAVNLTLLRSPFAAHHDPVPAARHVDQPVCDQGVHEFELDFRGGPDTNIAQVADRSRRLQSPPLVWDLTG